MMVYSDMSNTVLRGDIWNWHSRGYWVVVTTNIGWDPETLRNNMGAGLALQAATRFPGLSRQYGELCRDLGGDTPVTPHVRHRLFLFPVKPLLDPERPEISWAQDADTATIERSAKQLGKLIADMGLSGQVAMTFPGCGNGNLHPSVVLPILERHLASKVVLVDRSHRSSFREMGAE